MSSRNAPLVQRNWLARRPAADLTPVAPPRFLAGASERRFRRPAPIRGRLVDVYA